MGDPRDARTRIARALSEHQESWEIRHLQSQLDMSMAVLPMPGGEIEDVAMSLRGLVSHAAGLIARYARWLHTGVATAATRCYAPCMLSKGVGRRPTYLLQRET